jgi:hypothetical protein
MILLTEIKRMRSQSASRNKIGFPSHASISGGRPPPFHMYIWKQRGSWGGVRLRPGRKPYLPSPVYNAIPATPPGAGWWHQLPSHACCWHQLPPTQRIRAGGDLAFFNLEV